MLAINIDGATPLDRLLRRYETTDTKCTACGFVDSSSNWTSRTNGTTVVYRHVCPSCDADREHVFRLDDNR